MGFRSEHRLSSKVGGQNHLNDRVLFEIENAYGVPMMSAIQNVETDYLIAFTHHPEPDQCVHFYLEDHALNRTWNRIEYYGSKFMDHRLVLTPDFSLFTDMPIALQVFNTYRSRYIGRYWQEMGLKVAPSVSWSDERSFEFCFLGAPKNSVVSISTQGAKNESLFMRGFVKMLEQLTPSQILVYGTSRYVKELSATIGVDIRFFKTHFETKRHGWKG